jgi:cytochrome d ubiquinol oxidase subunit II
MKSEGATQDWAYKLVKPLLAAVLIIFLVISVWTPFVDAFVAERWFSGFSAIWLLPILGLLSAFWIYRSVSQRREGTPFIATMALFIFTYLGLLASKWPYVVPPNYTLADAASAHESQLFLLIGLLFVIPIVLVYTAWTYWVFRGKVKADQGYH